MTRVGNHALDALRHEIVLVLVVLEVTRTRTLAVLERRHRAHAAIDDVLTTVGVDLLARRLFRARENRAEHHAVSTRRQRLRHVARKLDATVGDDGNARATERLRRAVDSRELRNANAADDARRADRARTDADLDRVRTALRQRHGGFTRRDIASNHVDLREMLDDVFRHLHDALRVTVGGVDHDHVDTSRRQLLHTGEIALAARDGRRDAQTELVVAVVGRILVLHQALHVGETVETHDLAGLVDQRELADLRRTHEIVRLLERGTRLRRNRRGLHHVLELSRLHRRKTHVGRRNHTHETVVRIQHRKPVKLQAHATLFSTQEGNVVVLVEANRIGNQTVQVVLDLRNLLRLVVFLQVLVNAADTTRQRHRNRHRGLRHRVHRRRHERYLHLRAARQLRLKRGLIRQKVSILRDQGNVIIGKTLVREGLHKTIQIFVHMSPLGRYGPFCMGIISKKPR